MIDVAVLEGPGLDEAYGALLAAVAAEADGSAGRPMGLRDLELETTFRSW
jgi:hypothetical protein